MCQLGCLHVSTNNIDNKSNIKVNVQEIKKFTHVQSCGMWWHQQELCP